MNLIKSREFLIGAAVGFAVAYFVVVPKMRARAVQSAPAQTGGGE